MNRSPIRPDRFRRIERGFAAIPNRFLHGGFFVSLEQLERSLYFFLALAGDRNGVSFYAYDKICSTLGVSPDDYVTAAMPSSTRTSSPSTASASRSSRCRRAPSPGRVQP